MNIRNDALFYKCQESDGLVSGSQYVDERVSTEAFHILLHNNAVYFTYLTNKYLMTVYDIATDTLKYYQGTSSSTWFRHMNAYSSTLYIVGIDLVNSPVEGFFIITQVSDPASNHEVSISIFDMDSTTGLYPVTTLAVNTTTLLNVTLSDTTLVTPSTLTYLVSSTYSDVSFYGNDLNIIALVPATVYSESLYLT
jgi:hypothetical protein